MASLSRAQKRADEREHLERAIHVEAEMLALRRKAVAWGAREDQESITSLSGRWEALSNWFPAPVVYRGVRYPSVEHAYQALKASDDTTAAEAIRTTPTAAEAHALGQKVKLPAGWERTKIGLMESLLRDKFRRDTALRERLLRTEGMNLIATNDWNETFWGVCGGKGSNTLGKALMKLRDEISTGSDIDAWLASSFELVSPSDPCDSLDLQVHKSGAVVDTIRLGTAQPIFLVGKHSTCHVQLEHPSISRRHAAFVRDKSRGVLLVDLASKAGTTLNGRRVPPSMGVTVENDAKIVFGGSSRTHVVQINKVDSLKMLAEQHAMLEAQLSQMERDASDETALFGLLPADKRGPDPNATSAFVGNLAFDVIEDEVKDFFEEKTGVNVVSVRLPKNKSTGEPSGIGFVEFETPAGLVAALETSGESFRGRIIKVDRATAQPNARGQSKSMSASGVARSAGPHRQRSPPYSPSRRDHDRDWARDEARHRRRDRDEHRLSSRTPVRDRKRSYDSRPEFADPRANDEDASRRHRRRRNSSSSESTGARDRRGRRASRSPKSLDRQHRRTESSRER